MLDGTLHPFRFLSDFFFNSAGVLSFNQFLQTRVLTTKKANQDTTEKEREEAQAFENLGKLNKLKLYNSKIIGTDVIEILSYVGTFKKH